MNVFRSYERQCLITDAYCLVYSQVYLAVQETVFSAEYISYMACLMRHWMTPALLAPESKLVEYELPKLQSKLMNMLTMSSIRPTAA